MQAAFQTRRMELARPLFETCGELRGIIEAGLHGMGRVWLDAPFKPRGAVMTCGDFLVCAGTPGPSARHLLRVALGSERREWVARCPGEWMDALERVAQVKREKRTAFAHDIQPEDAHLRNLVACGGEEVTFVPVEGEWIPWCRGQEWTRDFVSCFADDEDYARNGLGMLVMRGGEIVAGASSYVAYPGGMEAQVQTREDCYGRGYATVAAAALILEAHGRGLRVTWDAANEASARIAMKLGYRRIGEYEIALINASEAL